MQAAYLRKISHEHYWSHHLIVSASVFALDPVLWLKIGEYVSHYENDAVDM